MSSVDVEEGYRCGRLWGGREHDAEKLVTPNRDWSNGEIKERKRVRGTRAKSSSRTSGSKLCPSGPRGGFVRKSTWKVADARRPLLSTSHTIQAGNDLFIGKDEEYIICPGRKATCTCSMCL